MNKMPKLSDLREPVDFYGKTWVVFTVSKEDIESKLGRKVKVSDDLMGRIADKLAGAMSETCYWDCLEGVLEYFEAEIK